MRDRKTLEEWETELIGNQFSRLTVLEVQPYYDKNGKRKGCQVLCRCSCGNTKITPVNSLIKGLTTSCGCLQKECSINKLNYWRENNPDEVLKIKKSNGALIKEAKKENTNNILEKHRSSYIGKKFGELTVLDIQSHIRKSTGKKDGFEAVCTCSCGNQIIVILSNLLNGNTQSCGCIKGKTLEQWKREIVGKQFGRITVLDVIQYNNPKTGGKKGFNVIGQCSCGNKTTTNINDLVSGSTQSCGCAKLEASVANGKLSGPENIKKAHIWMKEHPEETKKFQEKAVCSMNKWHKEHPEESKELRERSTQVLLNWGRDHKEDLRNRLIKNLHNRNISNISMEEKEVLDFLLSLGYPVDRQFLIDDHYFDFKIDRFLIEYNGSVYHYSNYENLDNPSSKEPSFYKKNKEYHKNLRDISLKKGYNLIQIWDYQWKNNKEFIQNLIRNQLNETANYRDYLDEDNLLNNDYGFNIEGEYIEPNPIWVATGYRTVVDESYSKGKVLVYNSGYTLVK